MAMGNKTSLDMGPVEEEEALVVAGGQGASDNSGSDSGGNSSGASDKTPSESDETSRDEGGPIEDEQLGTLAVDADAKAVAQGSRVEKVLDVGDLEAATKGDRVGKALVGMDRAPADADATAVEDSNPAVTRPCATCSNPFCTETAKGLYCQTCYDFWIAIDDALFGRDRAPADAAAPAVEDSNPAVRLPSGHWPCATCSIPICNETAKGSHCKPCSNLWIAINKCAAEQGFEVVRMIKWIRFSLPPSHMQRLAADFTKKRGKVYRGMKRTEFDLVQWALDNNLPLQEFLGHDCIYDVFPHLVRHETTRASEGHVGAEQPGSEVSANSCAEHVTCCLRQHIWFLHDVVKNVRNISCF